MYEIERKFLVASDGWRSIPPLHVEPISQGYIPAENACVRVRISRGAELTIKSKPLDKNMRKRLEINVPIKTEEALILMRDVCAFELHKIRYTIDLSESSCDVGNRWEVDVFQGPLDGLIMAEIELFHEDDAFLIPSWLGAEVTEHEGFSNYSLARDGLKYVGGLIGE